MRFAWIAAAMLAVALVRPVWAGPAVVGDYVETRSLNVYAGACHFEGEYVTGGREAVLVWNFRVGEADGVSLAGARVVALVSGDKNLAVEGACKRSVLYVSASSDAQRDAAVGLIRARAGASLGEVLAVRSGSIAFENGQDLYRVAVDGVAELRVRKAPGQLCCIQQYRKWYEPFTPVADSKIGFSLVNRYRESLLAVTWSASEMNNAFFGEFKY